MKFIGQIISSEGVQPDPSNIETIRLWPVPTLVYDILVFLRMAGYYSCFVYKYANKAAALTDLLKKGKKCQSTTAALK